ncbi:hypothetical protein [Lysinibacillus xylanilyticus]|uniref:HTH cro/C1-type domain-containing protein n=1 Tax=Lysinibacillus xylanilyticus TaxID=582475 RepID=A0ABT4EUI5_9BACI|nr:hypothetical protein [Lysinibacillus xylanilyticus]MCY9549337.1 hypothetical protein [Lysinibacillus xylanilyticus]
MATVIKLSLENAKIIAEILGVPLEELFYRKVRELKKKFEYQVGMTITLENTDE